MSKIIHHDVNVLLAAFISQHPFHLIFKEWYLKKELIHGRRFICIDVGESSAGHRSFLQLTAVVFSSTS